MQGDKMTEFQLVRLC